MVGAVGEHQKSACSTSNWEWSLREAVNGLAHQVILSPSTADTLAVTHSKQFYTVTLISSIAIVVPLKPLRSVLRTPVIHALLVTVIVSGHIQWLTYWALQLLVHILSLLITEYSVVLGAFSFHTHVFGTCTFLEVNCLVGANTSYCTNFSA